MMGEFDRWVISDNATDNSRYNKELLIPICSDFDSLRHFIELRLVDSSIMGVRIDVRTKILSLNNIKFKHQFVSFNKASIYALRINQAKSDDVHKIIDGMDKILDDMTDSLVRENKKPWWRFW